LAQLLGQLGVFLTWCEIGGRCSAISFALRGVGGTRERQQLSMHEIINEAP
jgi:hypothetical protein